MMNNKYVVSTGGQTRLRGVHWCTASRREDRGLSAILIVTHHHTANITLLSLAKLICHMSLRQHTTHSRHGITTSSITIIIYQLYQIICCIVYISYHVTRGNVIRSILYTNSLWFSPCKVREAPCLKLFINIYYESWYIRGFLSVTLTIIW